MMEMDFRTKAEIERDKIINSTLKMIDVKMFNIFKKNRNPQELKEIAERIKKVIEE